MEFLIAALMSLVIIFGWHIAVFVGWLQLGAGCEPYIFDAGIALPFLLGGIGLLAEFFNWIDAHYP